MYQIGDIVRVHDGRTGKVIAIQPATSTQEVVVKLANGDIINGSAEQFTAINVLKKT